MCSFGEGELKLVTERCADGRVEQGGGAGLLADLLQLEALVRRQVGVGVQGGVDRVRKKGVKLVVHHPTLLPGEVDDRWSRLRSTSASCPVRKPCVNLAKSGLRKVYAHG